MRSITIGKIIQTKEIVFSLEEIKKFFQEIDKNNYIVLAACPCRTDREISGKRNCFSKNPVGACMFFGDTAKHLLSTGTGLKINKKKALEYIEFMISKGLNPTSDNNLSSDGVICLCCGCCCSHLRRSFFHDEKSKPFNNRVIPVKTSACKLCGKCIKGCKFDLIKIDKRTNLHTILYEKCIGCGLCAFVCPENALSLQLKN